MPVIQAMPYAPGQATGPLRNADSKTLSGAIALLRPADIHCLHAKPAGIIVIGGAPFSHPMISLLHWGVPAVILDDLEAEKLSEGIQVLLDGSKGVITTDIAQWIKENRQFPRAPASEHGLRTMDGEPVALLSSIRDAEGARYSVIHGATAIGLVRSEFLQAEDGAPPDRGFYERALAEICKNAGKLPVTVRLLDVSADKYPPWLPPIKGAKTPLGLQGGRLFETFPVKQVVKAQLEAVHELSSHYQLKLIIPFLSQYEDLLHWRDYVRRYVPESVPLGAMVETPSAALDIDRWLQAVDFVAVGCNDLMQNIFAADRDKPALKAYLDPYAPVLFRLFRQMAEAASGNLDKVQLCGLFPQFAGIMPALLGMGYRVFSVEVMQIPYLAEVIQGVSLESAQGLAGNICEARRSSEVKKLLGC